MAHAGGVDGMAGAEVVTAIQHHISGWHQHVEQRFVGALHARID